jgi:hypothetical protein
MQNVDNGVAKRNVSWRLAAITLNERWKIELRNTGY